MIKDITPYDDDIGLYLPHGLGGGTDTKCILYTLDKNWASSAMGRPRHQHIGDPSVQQEGINYEYTCKVQWLDEVKTPGYIQIMGTKIQGYLTGDPDDNESYMVSFSWQIINGIHMLQVSNPETHDKRSIEFIAPLDKKPHTVRMIGRWEESGWIVIWWDDVEVFRFEGITAPAGFGSIHTDFGLYADESIFNDTDEVNFLYSNTGIRELYS